MRSDMILTDGDCGFCQRSAAHVPKLGVKVEITTLQAVDLEALGVDPDRAMLEMAFVGADGSVHYGAPAWAATLATGPLVWRLVARMMRAPGFRQLAAGFYRLIANNRYRLPGGSQACALPQPLVPPRRGE